MKKRGGGYSLPHRGDFRGSGEGFQLRAARGRAACHQAVEVRSAAQRAARLDGIGARLQQFRCREEHRHRGVRARHCDAEHVVAGAVGDGVGGARRCIAAAVDCRALGALRRGCTGGAALARHFKVVLAVQGVAHGALYGDLAATDLDVVVAAERVFVEAGQPECYLTLEGKLSLREERPLSCPPRPRACR